MLIFIDTNVFLSFYHFSNEDLEELNKLLVLLDRKEVQLYLPQQVRTEFRRNREAKIADAMRKLREQKLSLHFPQICKDYPEYPKLRDLQSQYEKLHASLLNCLNEDIRHRKLKADAIIEQLFAKANVIQRTDSIVGKARFRMEIGNPPGKKDSLGDALNWVTLLEAITEGSELHFVSGDKDYCSVLDDEAFNDYLLQEWCRTKKSDLIFYKRISAFFQAKFPEIKVATELEKDLLIKDLGESSSFATTHAVVAKLSKFNDFTPAQRSAIVHAATTNSQVGYIATDDDVSSFLSSVVEGHEDQIGDHSELDNLRALLGDNDDSEASPIGSQ
jgi:predicted nucleic acid-binding protein